jgi:hypothetical protein
LYCDVTISEVKVIQTDRTRRCLYLYVSVVCWFVRCHPIALLFNSDKFCLTDRINLPMFTALLVPLFHSRYLFPLRYDCRCLQHLYINSGENMVSDISRYKKLCHLFLSHSYYYDSSRLLCLFLVSSLNTSPAFISHSLISHFYQFFFLVIFSIPFCFKLVF